MATTFLTALLAAFAVVSVRAETHTISFDNQCGKGTPQLIIGGQVVSTGTDYTHSGVLSGIAYLQTGGCGFNGEDCTLMEFTLDNPVASAEGSGSSADISLISPHKFNVATAFSYYNGCDNQGTACNSGSCNTAFFQPNDNQVQVQCQADNVNLKISFCSNGGTGSDSSPSSQSHDVASSTSSKPSSSAKAASTTAEVKAVAPVTTKASSASAATSTSPSRKSCKAQKRAAEASLGGGNLKRSNVNRTAREDMSARLYIEAHERMAAAERDGVDAVARAHALRSHHQHRRQTQH